MNNVHWCDVVCRTHGHPGEFLDGIWINRHPTPRFYPNAITLSPTPEPAVHLPHIRDLLAAGLPAGWGVKDSLVTLDLAPLGFRVLFDARWLWRPASLPRPRCDLPGVRWARLMNADDLARWEHAWAGAPSGVRPERIFLPALLADEDIAVIAAFQDRAMVAGATANRAAGIAGLSNLFLPAEDAGRLRAACVAAVMDIFPNPAVVCYTAGPGITALQALGFEVLGPLRVWEKAAPDTPS